LEVADRDLSNNWRKKEKRLQQINGVGLFRKGKKDEVPVGREKKRCPIPRPSWGGCSDFRA